MAFSFINAECIVYQTGFFFVNLKVDVIVNSVGQDLAMTSGSCSAIVAAAGPNLAKELLQNNTSLPYGKVAVTKGYNLKCAEVFHGALLSWYSKGAGSTNQPDIVSFHK